MPQVATRTQKRYEFKSLSFREFKMVDEDAGIFEGYLAVFNNDDEVGDLIQKNAFKKTLADKEQKRRNTGSPYLFPILWNHDEDIVIGGCLEAHEDEHGLFVRCQLDMNVQKARDIRSGLKMGYLDSMSIGYDAKQRKYQGSRRILIEIALWEGSVVTFPANTLALIDLRSVKKKLPSKTERGLTMPNNHRRNAGRRNVKALDFQAALTRQEDDLQQEWANLFRALVSSVASQMYDYEVTDKSSAVASVVDDFGSALESLVERSQAASFYPMFDDDGDSFYDPSCETSGAMSADAAFEKKAGRAISKPNADRMTKGLDGISEAVKAIMGHHKDLYEMVKSAMPPEKDGENADDTSDASKKSEKPDETKSMKIEDADADLREMAAYFAEQRNSFKALA